MDKFTKTTEVDISNMNLVEDDTPQKSKIGKIIAIITSLILAVAAWVYVMETDETIIEQEFKDINVTIVGNTDKYNITAEKVNVVLLGTHSQLVDVDPSKIVVTVNAMSQYKDTVTECLAMVSYSDEELGVEVKDKSIKVKVTFEEKIAK